MAVRLPRSPSLSLLDKEAKPRGFTSPALVQPKKMFVSYSVPLPRARFTEPLLESSYFPTGGFFGLLAVLQVLVECHFFQRTQQRALQDGEDLESRYPLFSSLSAPIAELNCRNLLVHSLRTLRQLVYEVNPRLSIKEVAAQFGHGQFPSLVWLESAPRHRERQVFNAKLLDLVAKARRLSQVSPWIPSWSPAGARDFGTGERSGGVAFSPYTLHPLPKALLLDRVARLGKQHERSHSSPDDVDVASLKSLDTSDAKSEGSYPPPVTPTSSYGKSVEGLSIDTTLSGSRKPHGAASRPPKSAGTPGLKSSNRRTRAVPSYRRPSLEWTGYLGTMSNVNQILSVTTRIRAVCQIGHKVILLANSERKRKTELLTAEYTRRREERAKWLEEEARLAQEEAKRRMERKGPVKAFRGQGVPAPYGRPVVPTMRDIPAPSEPVTPTSSTGKKHKGKEGDTRTRELHSRKERRGRSVERVPTSSSSYRGKDGKQRPVVIWNIKTRHSSLSSRRSRSSSSKAAPSTRMQQSIDVASRGGSVAGYSLGPAGASSRASEVEFEYSETGNAIRRREKGKSLVNAATPPSTTTLSQTQGSSESESDFISASEGDLEAAEWYELQRELHEVAKKAENDLRRCKATHTFMAHQLSILHKSLQAFEFGHSAATAIKANFKRFQTQHGAGGNQGLLSLPEIKWCLKLVDKIEETILQCPPSLGGKMGAVSQLLLSHYPLQEWA